MAAIDQAGNFDHVGGTVVEERAWLTFSFPLRVCGEGQASSS